MGAHVAHPVRLAQRDPELAALPEVSAELAREIVRTRGDCGGFSSLEYLGMQLDLPGDAVERLRRRLIFLPL